MSDTPETMPSLEEALAQDQPTTGSANAGVLSGALFGCLVTLVVGVLIFYGWKQWSDPYEGISEVGRDLHVSTQIGTSSASMTRGDYDGWPVYRNQSYGFFVRIPQGWEVTEDPSGDSVYIADASASEPSSTDDSITFVVPSEGLAFFDDAYESREAEEVGDQTFAVYERVVPVDSPLAETTEENEESSVSVAAPAVFAYVLEKDGAVLVFTAPTGQRSVLLSILRSYEETSGESAVAGLNTSDVLFARATWDGLHELVGYSLENAVETTHLTLTAEQGAVRDADVSDDRTQLAYVTDRAIHIRDLSTGVERAIATIEGENEYSYASIAFSPDRSFVAGRMLHPTDQARPYIVRLSTDAIVPDDITFPPHRLQWVSDEQLLLLFQGGAQGTDGVQLYNVETDETVYLDTELWLGSARPFAASVNADGSEVAVLGTEVVLLGEGEQETRETRVYLWLFDARTGERVKTVDTTLLVEDVELVTYDYFGVAWSQDDAQLVLSFQGDVFVVDPLALSGIDLDPRRSDVGTVESVLENGDVVVSRVLYSDVSAPHFWQAGLYDPVAESLLYVSEPTTALSVPR